MWRGPCEGVHRRTSLMSSSLLFQQCPAGLLHLIWMILKIGGKWPFNCCFMVCCFSDLFNIARSILVQNPSCFFSMCIVSVHVVHPYNSIDTAAAWKKSRFILSDWSDFHRIVSLSIVVHAFARCILTSLLTDEILLPRYVNLSSNFREPPFWIEMAPSWLKHIYSVFFRIHNTVIPVIIRVLGGVGKYLINGLKNKRNIKKELFKKKFQGYWEKFPEFCLYPSPVLQ